MTNEEAIKTLDAMWKMLTSAYDEIADSFVLAYSMAIDALKAQIDKDINVSNNDTISRQAAIDEIEYELEMINSALDSITLDFNARERLRQRRGEAREILNSIQQLPSAQPEQSSEIQDILEYLDTVLHPIISPDHWNVYSELHNMISMLPSAQPERKTGKWIYGEHDVAMCDGYRCNKCGFFVPWDYKHKSIDYIKDYHCCPNCYAYMKCEPNGD